MVTERVSGRSAGKVNIRVTELQVKMELELHEVLM